VVKLFSWKFKVSENSEEEVVISVDCEDRSKSIVSSRGSAVEESNALLESNRLSSVVDSAVVSLKDDRDDVAKLSSLCDEVLFKKLSVYKEDKVELKELFGTNSVLVK